MPKRRKLQQRALQQQQQQRSQQRFRPRPDVGGKAASGAKAHHQQQQQQQHQQPKKKQQQHKQQHHEEPTIPFRPEERILLIGEGDLSFAASIVRHHGCANVTATVLERDHAELVAKYPAVDANIAAVLGTETDGGEAKDEAGGDADSRSSKPAEEVDDEDDEEDEEQEEEEDHDGDDSEADPEDEDAVDDDDDEEEEENDSDDATTTTTPRPPKVTHNLPRNNRLLYNVDATKLPPSLARPPRFDHVLFNFPHVGGKSTDTNRQVRHNQSLLVSFFERALPALAPRGSIVVTLFEGEPYTLWNVRDLARHAGLAVERSFRFQAAAYPGYRHARTCGVVRSRKGNVGGGWRGEERAARSFVFRRKADVDACPPAARKKKRSRGDDSSSDDDSD